MKLKWKLLLILGAMGVMFTYMGVKDWLVISKPVKDITELWNADYRDLKAGDHVCFNVSMVWDQAGSETTTSKTYGVTTSQRESSRYYLLPFSQDYDETEDVLYPTPFLLVKLGSSYYDLMDNQISKTETWWRGTGDYDEIPISSVHIDGKLVKMPKDIRTQIEATLDPGEDLEDIMLPLIFENIAAPGAVKTMSIAGILCLMVFLVILFFMIRGEALTAPQPFSGVRKQPFAPQGGNPGSGFAQTGTTAGSAFAQQPQGGGMGSAFAQTGAGSNTLGRAGTAGSGAAPQGGNTGAFGQQPQSGAFGTQSTAAPRQPESSQSRTASAYSTATLETTQIPYIPGISLGPAPGAPAQSGPSPMGPSSSGGSEPLGPSGGISGPSQLGPSPLGPSPIGGSEPATPEPKADEAEDLTEEQKAQMAAMSFGTSQPAVLPLGGNATSVHVASQAATLPLGVSPTQVSSGNSFTMPPAQQESTAAPAAPPSPIYGTAPAAAPEKSAQPEEDENAPLYADNTQMKKVFQGAFANPVNNGKN